MNEDELQKRRARYSELLARVPARKMSERIDWLVENLGCSRNTARIWNMRNTKRPMPDAKLSIMQRLLDSLTASREANPA